jgi:hypothetical protein
VRDVLLASSPEAGAEAANQVLLGELLALRTILINLVPRQNSIRGKMASNSRIGQ